MRQANTAIVQDIYAAFAAGRLADVPTRLADRLTFIQPGGDDIPWSGTYTTPAEVYGFLAKLAETTDIRRFEARQYIESVDTVVALGVWEGRSTTTGKLFASDWSMVWKLRDGKVYFHQSFFDTATLGRLFR